MFEDEDLIMCGANLKFDLKFLRAAGVEVYCNIADVVLAHWLLDENA